MIPKMGSVRLRKLLEVYNNPQRILTAEPGELRVVDGIGNDIASGGVGWDFTSTGLVFPSFLAFTNDAGVPLRLPGGPVPVPEPSPWSMLAAGTFSLLALRRRKRNSA